MSLQFSVLSPGKFVIGGVYDWMGIVKHSDQERGFCSKLGVAFFVQAILFRDASVCHACVGIPWPGVSLSLSIYLYQSSLLIQLSFVPRVLLNE